MYLLSVHVAMPYSLLWFLVRSDGVKIGDKKLNAREIRDIIVIGMLSHAWTWGLIDNA